MNTNILKYQNFYAKKVYCCSCVLNGVQECFEAGDKNLGEILHRILCYEFNLPFLSDQIFCFRVGENKEDCIILCYQHLIVILLAKMKYFCSTTDEEDLAPAF